MRTYKCDICGKEVEYEHMLKQFPAYDPVMQTVEMRDHCPSCYTRALSILTVTAMTHYPELEFDAETTLHELVTDMRGSLRAEALELIADRWTTFKVVFTRDPTWVPKEEEE